MYHGRLRARLAARERHDEDARGNRAMDNPGDIGTARASTARGAEAFRTAREFVADNGLWFCGLCCGNIWIGWMNGTHALQPAGLWRALCAATMACTLLLAALWGWRHPGRVRAAYAPDWPVAALMALGTLPAAGMLGGAQGPSTMLAAAATVLTEVGMAWLFVRWGVFLSRLDLRQTVGCVFGAHVVGCTAKLLLYYVPAQMVAIPVAALPLVSILALHQASRRLPELDGMTDAPAQEGVAETIWCTGQRGSWGPLWKIATFIAVWRLIFCTADVGGVSISLSTVCCVAEIGVALLIMYMLLARSGSFTFQQVWSIFLVLLGVALLCTASTDPALASVGASVMAASGSLLVMFVWLVFADVSHHSTLHPFVVFGTGRIAYELPSIVAGVVPGLSGASTQDPFFSCVALFCLLAFSVLFFDLRDPTLALVFSDFQKTGETAPPDTLQSVCEAAAQESGLTAREAEVLLLLCQGRTRAYIAETLYLSENTVRGHTQHIYAKLDVHNKTELQRKLGV